MAIDYGFLFVLKNKNLKCSVKFQPSFPASFDHHRSDLIFPPLVPAQSRQVTRCPGEYRP